MGKAIVVGLTVIVLAIIIAAVVVYFRRRQSREAAQAHGWAIKGDWNKRQEQAVASVLHDQHRVLVDMLRIDNVDYEGLTLLSQSHRSQVEALVLRYNKLKETVQ